MLEVNLTKLNFEEEVLQSEKLVLVDFWANWCGPCKMIAPVLEQIAEEYKEKVKIGKVNVDEESEIARQYQILSIPTLILFKKGKIMNVSVGFHSKSEIEKIIQQNSF